MADTIIGIKELHRNLKRVADSAVKGRSYTVVRGSKPVFRIEPVPIEPRGGGNSMREILKRLEFSDKDKNLSLNIDKIVYGSNR